MSDESRALSRRQSADARKSHIRELVALGLNDFGMGQQLGVSPKTAAKYRRTVLEREVKTELPHPLRKKQHILILEKELEFARLKSREAHTRGEAKGKIGWQNIVLKTLAMIARVEDFNTPDKVQVEYKDAVEVKDVLPEGLTIVEDYPWLREPDLEKRNLLYLEHQAEINGTDSPPPQPPPDIDVTPEDNDEPEKN